MILTFKKFRPSIHPTVFVAPDAAVIGQVRIGRHSSVWFGAVLRGDITRITVGEGTNIQDQSVLHTETGIPCVLGDGIVVGHQATVHACRVGDGAMIGIGARVLNGARIGKESIVAAGAVVLEGAVIPPRSLAVGVPAKVVRRLSGAEVAKIRKNALRYRELADWYRENLGVIAGGGGLLPIDDLSKIF